jgi:beta-glucosidase
MRRLLPGLLVLLAALPAAANAATHDTLTVVSLNLWNDQGEWPRRLARIVPGLRALNADVILLQEVLQHPGLPNQALTIAESLGVQAHFASVDSVTRPKRYGNAILTRWPVLRADDRNLAPADDYRVATHVVIRRNGRAIDVYDTHLHHTLEGAAIRATQLRDLLAFVDATRGAGALVLGGDFNAALEAPEMGLLAGRFVDAYAATHPGHAGPESTTLNPAFGYPPRQIDHVFAPREGRPALTPVSCDLLFRDAGPDSVWATDHFGVVARFAIGRR